MAGICKLLVGNGLRPILGPRATLPAGQGAPEESSPALGPCPQQPPVPAAAAVSLRASPSLFLCSPHLCRSHCCGSELHGETPLQVRFLGVWSVPSTPSSSPRPPQAGDFPSPRPLPAEGAGGWARTLHNAPGLPLGRAAGTLVAARGGRAVLTADRLPGRSSVSLPSLPPSPPLQSWHHSPTPTPTPPPWALPASPRKPPPPPTSLPPLPHPQPPRPVPSPSVLSPSPLLLGLLPTLWLALSGSLARILPFPQSLPSPQSPSNSLSLILGG